MPSRRARYLRKNLTEAEKLLWRRLRYKQIDGFRFRRQAPLGQFIVDFLCPEARLVIELDGGQHAFTTDYDEQRTKCFELVGYRVLRFWNRDVFENLDGMLERIREALHHTG